MMTEASRGSTSAPILIVVAAPKEADAVREGLASRDQHDVDAVIVTSGVGRTNAASAVHEAVAERRAADESPFTGVLSLGIAGALPGPDGAPFAAIGTVLCANACVYMEEGMVTPDGFTDTAGFGFPLGDFSGNDVPVDSGWADRQPDDYLRARIATVATCSGTNQAARTVAERTGASAEAMEGAAVVHAARRLGLPGLEIRVISNTTGDRADQLWDFQAAWAALRAAARTMSA